MYKTSISVERHSLKLKATEQIARFDSWVSEHVVYVCLGLLLCVCMEFHIEHNDLI